MKTTKFRAWDKENQRMFGMHNNSMMQLSDFWEWVENVEGYTPDIMQFTGLQDKNGKDIYEGDIIQIETGFKATVKWNDYYNSFMAFSASGSWFLNDCKYPEMGILAGDYSMEVIGNIHEIQNYYND